MSSSKTDQLTAVATEAVKTISHSVQSAMNPIDDYDSPDSPSQARTLQYTRRGLKMVGEKSLFDLKEPIWHPDEKVGDKKVSMAETVWFYCTLSCCGEMQTVCSITYLRKVFGCFCHPHHLMNAIVWV